MSGVSSRSLPEIGIAGRVAHIAVTVADFHQIGVNHMAIATQIIVFPWFGIETGLAEHLTIGLAFVGVSLARGYLLRRLFETIRLRSAK